MEESFAKIGLYGIKQCSTVRNARSWLDTHKISYQFYDYESEGLEPEELYKWIQALPWSVLLNKSSLTFRNLPDTEKTDLDAHKAFSLMQKYPKIIKRPILQFQGRFYVGFKEETYQKIFLELS